MRLSTEKVKEGILHPAGPEVRGAALRYFTGSFSSDISVMPRVIEAVEKYGRADAFDFVPALERVPQTGESLLWAIRELKSEDIRDDWDVALQALVQWADPKLLQAHHEDLGSPELLKGSRAVEFMEFRIELASWDAERCWRELDAFCDEYRDEPDIEKVPLLRAEAIVDRLGRETNLEPDKVLAPLAIGIEPSIGDPLLWKQPLLARLTGFARMDAAVPRLVAYLTSEDDWFAEECSEALVRIGSDAIVQTLRNEYRAGDSDFRVSAAWVLGCIHSDRAVATLIELLDVETNQEVRTFLATSLAGQYSTEGNDALRPLALKKRFDPSVADLREELLVASLLMDEDFPERHAIHVEIQEVWRKRREIIQSLPGLSGKSGDKSPLLRESPMRFEEEIVVHQQPIRVEHKVGRNDPCPCGSGKKYKKCCLRKEGYSGGS